MSESIEIITAVDLMAYPGAGNPSDEDAAVWVMLVNGLVTEAWASPEDPVPFWVKTIALRTAARAASNPKGLASWTRSLDDGSRTDDELARLANARAFNLAQNLDREDEALEVLEQTLVRVGPGVQANLLRTRLAGIHAMAPRPRRALELAEPSVDCA